MFLKKNIQSEMKIKNKCCFAPTSKSPMCKLYRFLESLGKSNGKRLSQILKLLLIKGVKSMWQKKDFFHLFILLYVFLPQLPKVQCPNLLYFWNPWGKVIVRIVLRFENFFLINDVKTRRGKPR